jgi:stearoyl-CoA desaturase (Delta-9 desaturase)
MSYALVLPDSIAGRGDAPPPVFACSWTNDGLEAAWVRVAGELDIATTPQLERTLREAQVQERLAVLDLRELAFVDSSGVHAIVDASNRARRAGRRLVVLRGPPNVDRMFTLTGSVDAVEIHDLDQVEPPVHMLAQLASSTRANAPVRGAADTVPIEHETSERVVRTMVFAVPPAALGVGGWLAWGGTLHWPDLLVLAITYTLTGLGVTVGYHRLFTHRSFKTTRTVRALLAVLGSMAVEGPVIEWVATHRKHHRFSDRRGDPHSPHVDHTPGWRGALRGLVHAHLGWMFRGKDMANPARYAKDLLADRDIRFISRTFPLWVAAGLALPFGLGVALTGSVAGGLTGLLWGGAVRVFLLHHVTFSINSLCHYFGRRPFPTGDQSRNLAWLAPLALGEAWHNNHHAFPTSARHGLGRWQLDPSAWLITGLEHCHLAWDVVRISAGRQQAKRGSTG